MTFRNSLSLSLNEDEFVTILFYAYDFNSSHFLCSPSQPLYDLATYWSYSFRRALMKALYACLSIKQNVARELKLLMTTIILCQQEPKELQELRNLKADCLSSLF